MTPARNELIDRPDPVRERRDATGLARRTALVTGSVALGALLTSAVLRRMRHTNLRHPHQVPPALDAGVREMEMMEGRVRFYERPGTGVPLVLLHSINAAGSSFEMKPIFDHYAARTERPLYALDWLGFGLSDRPPVRYAPAVYQRQLRRFLSECVHQPADVVALSLASEYAATVAHTLPYLVRRLVLVAPTALSGQDEALALRRAIVRLADTVGAFELFYHRLTRPAHLRRFYEQQIFRNPADVPDALVRYGHEVTQVFGAHHAPRYFVEGALFMREAARHTYASLRLPALILVPESPAGLVQRFDRLSEILAQNPQHLAAKRLPSGLLPQWDTPGPLFDVLDAFFSEPVQVEHT